MYEFFTNKAKWLEDSEGCWISFRVNGRSMAAKGCEAAEGKEVRVTLAEAKKSRSLDANAYLWVLIGKLSKATGTPKETVYRQLIRDVGDSYEIFPVKDEAVERMKRIWESRGLGWQTANLGESKLRGYTNLVMYYGSSVYDTGQMRTLLHSAIAECEALNIPTVTPEEEKKLIENWRDSID